AATILFWAIPVTIAVALNMPPHWCLFFFPIIIWLCKRCCNWGEYYWLTNKKDWVMMYLNSLILLGPAQALIFYFFGFQYPIFIPAIICWPLLYWIGKRLPVIQNLFTRGFSEWAENLYPLSVAFGILFLS